MGFVGGEKDSFSLVGGESPLFLLFPFILSIKILRKTFWDIAFHCDFEVILGLIFFFNVSIKMPFYHCLWLMDFIFYYSPSFIHL